MLTCTKASIILLEDEVDLRDEITDYFSYHGIEVHAVSSIRQYWQYASTIEPDLIILDRMLPDGDGLTVLQELRRTGSRCGVVVLTAKDSPQDRQQGLDELADHYLSKPIALAQLLAVVKALLWRMLPAHTAWELDPNSWTLKDPTGKGIVLTSQEFTFIRSLAAHPHQPRSREKLAEQLGKDVDQYDVRNLDALVMRLRKKATHNKVSELPVRAVHGVGYTFAADIKVFDPVSRVR